MKYKLMSIASHGDKEIEVKDSRVDKIFEMDKWINQKSINSGGIFWKDGFQVKFNNDPTTYLWRKIEDNQLAYVQSNEKSTDYTIQGRPAQYIIVNKDGLYAKRFKHPNLYNSDDLGEVESIEEATVYPSRSEYSDNYEPFDHEVYQFCPNAKFIEIEVKIVRTITEKSETIRQDTVNWRSDQYNFKFAQSLNTAIERELHLNGFISFKVKDDGTYKVLSASERKSSVLLGNKSRSYIKKESKYFPTKKQLAPGYYYFEITEDILNLAISAYRMSYIKEHYDNNWS